MRLHVIILFRKWIAAVNVEVSERRRIVIKQAAVRFPLRISYPTDFYKLLQTFATVFVLIALFDNMAFSRWRRVYSRCFQ
jgi:hypothetical protein